MTKKSFANNWKPVTIGGMTGILVGTGATMAYHSMASDNNVDEVVDNSPKQAASNDDMSFSEAFKTARAELGSGKTFEWHGKTYSTCTRKEWEEMLDAENDISHIKEEKSLTSANLGDREKDETEQPIVKNQSKEDDGQDDVLIASRDASVKNNDAKVTVDEDAASNEDVTIKNNSTTEDVTASVVDSPSEESPEELTWNKVVNDDDVRILGYGDVVLDNGKEITVQELDVNGQRVAVIDIDQDGTADIAVTDLNHNNQPDDGEILDLHTGETYSPEDQSPFDGNDVNIEYYQV